MSSGKSNERPVIRFYGVREAKSNFARILEEAQVCVVIIMNHSRPVAMIIGIKGLSVEEVVLAQTISDIRTLIERLDSPPKTPPEEE